MSISTYFKNLKRDFNRWSMFTLIILVFISIPLVTIIWFLTDGPGELWHHIVKNVLWDYVKNSLFLMIGAVTLTLIFGVSSAWFVSRYQTPFSNKLEWLLIIPLALPSYITAYTYAGFFDYGGTLESLASFCGITTLPKINFMNILGLIFVLGISLYPYVYVASRAVFVFQSGRLIEASKILGASEKNTFFKIVLPMARPAIVGGAILVIMEILNDYGAAKHYGVSTFTTGIFRAWFSLEAPKTAIYLCALLLVIVFTVIWVEKKQRKSKSYASNSKSDIRLPKLKLKKTSQLFVLFLITTPIFLGFILPVGQLVYWAFLTFESVASTQFFKIALQSFFICVATSILTVIFALSILYFSKWNRFNWLKNSSRFATIGYAIPGAVLAIGVMIPSLKLDHWLIGLLKNQFGINVGLLLNGTLLILIYAYAIRFLAVAYNPLASNHEKIGNSLSESSKLLGKNNLTTFFKIDFHLLKPSLVGALVLVFIDTLKELPLTLILKPYNVQTLAVKAYEYASDELIMESALPSLFIVGTGVLSILILQKYILKENE